MKDEEIKQNAEEYALEQSANGNNAEDYNLAKQDYLAGAHSRDEEIEQLKKAISSAQKAMAELAKIASNPWISVEERLPEMHEFKERDCTILHSDDILLASIHGVHFGCVWFEKGRYTFGGRKDAIKEEKWTHWMPIPKLRMGE